MPRRFPSPSRWRQRERKTSSSATSLGVASQVSDISGASQRLQRGPSSVGTCGTVVGRVAPVWPALNLLGQTNENCETTNDVPLFGTFGRNGQPGAGHEHA